MRTPTPLYPPLTQLQPLRPAPRRRPVRRAASPAAAPTGPPRYKLALLTWVAAYPIITVILGLLGPELASWPLGLRTLVVSVLMVATLTWFVMPGLTRLLRPWLRPA
jgi:antibiotic biosynthesis monooxygenase (ABM) superfamily enzyme